MLGLRKVRINSSYSGLTGDFEPMGDGWIMNLNPLMSSNQLDLLIRRVAIQIAKEQLQIALNRVYKSSQWKCIPENLLKEERCVLTGSQCY